MTQTTNHAPNASPPMLKRFVQAKKEEVAELEQSYAPNGPPTPCSQRSPGLAHALREAEPGAVIAEYKPASPSRGPIAPDLSPEQAGELFVQGGAAAISVLTDRTFFGSSPRALFALAGTGLPLLRKDFIIHPAQVAETAATPAAAFLLIARLFARDREGMYAVYRAGINAGLEPVVEVFDTRDVAAAKELGAQRILVNSRDLDTLHLDLNVHRKLIQDREKGELWICASGLSTRSQIQNMAELGYAACLIGTSIMDSPDRLAALQALTTGHGLSPTHSEDAS
ncbi:MAG: indole-3-glycerol-phosphate synthase [Desulfovermiculus sp.]